MPTLFDTLRIGDLEVPNRIFLAPLTRNRSTGLGVQSRRFLERADCESLRL